MRVLFGPNERNWQGDGGNCKIRTLHQLLLEASDQGRSVRRVMKRSRGDDKSRQNFSRET